MVGLYKCKEKLIWYCLLINRDDTLFCKTKNNKLKIYLSNTEDNYWMLLQKPGVDALKTVTKKVTHKAAEATQEFREKKICGR